MSWVRGAPQLLASMRQEGGALKQPSTRLAEPPGILLLARYKEQLFS